MAKVFMIFSIIFLMATAGLGQTWVNTNQTTVAWDAVSYGLDAGETLIYKTYLSNAKTDPNKTNPASIGETEALQYQFTFTEKGSYFVGLQTIIRVDGEDVAASEIVWSDDPIVAAGGQTFGIRFYPNPPNPTGIRPVTE